MQETRIALRSIRATLAGIVDAYTGFKGATFQRAKFDSCKQAVARLQPRLARHQLV